MRKRGSFAFLSVCMLTALLAPVSAEDVPEGERKPALPVRCVALATSWDLALKDAKARVVPIVLHAHGFYCGGCHRVHASVLCDIEYIDFAYENATEVIVLDRLQEGVDKGEPGAATFEAKQGGKTVHHLCNLPGLTIADVLALNASKARTYNTEGGLPYTALIDPFTEAEIKAWKGWKLTASDLKEGIQQARETLTKARGPGKARPELKAFGDGATTSAAKLKSGDFAGALDPYTALLKRAEKEGWALRLRERLEQARAAIVAAATEALDNLEADKDIDLAKTKKDLTALLPRLRGTGLEQRAKDLLATL